jgi:hypothetical protein
LTFVSRAHHSQGAKQRFDLIDVCAGMIGDILRYLARLRPACRSLSAFELGV